MRSPFITTANEGKIRVSRQLSFSFSAVSHFRFKLVLERDFLRRLSVTLAIL